MFNLIRGTLPIAGLILISAWLSQTAMAAYPPAYPAAPVAPGAGCCAPAPCCNTCGQPPDVCTCTSYKPVVNTCYHQQPIVGYHDVCRTCYRQEPYCVTVPVTKVDCVTVDQGCYKMVWCPHIVTQQVPHTEYHQQVCTRTVPYTVNQRVPHVMTQIVPEYRVRYVPETHTYMKPACPQPIVIPNCGSPAPGCGYPLGSSTEPGMAPQAMVAAPPAQTQPMAVAPEQPGIETPTITVPQVGGPPQSSVGIEATVASANVNPALANQYLRARAAASVWQTNRGLSAP